MKKCLSYYSGVKTDIKLFKPKWQNTIVIIGLTDSLKVWLDCGLEVWDRLTDSYYSIMQRPQQHNIQLNITSYNMISMKSQLNNNNNNMSMSKAKAKVSWIALGTM